MKTTETTMNQRYIRLLTKSVRAIELLREILEVEDGDTDVKAEDYGATSARVFLIRQSINMCEREISALNLSFLEDDLKNAFHYVTSVRRTWRTRSRQHPAVAWLHTTDLTRNYSVGYYRDGHTGNFIVTYAPEETKRLGPNRVKRAVILPGALRKVAPEVAPDSIAGVIEVNYHQMVKLGFFVKQVSVA